MAKPSTSLLLRERNPVPPGRGSLTGNDNLEVTCPPLSMTAGPCVGQDVAKNSLGGKLEAATFWHPHVTRGRKTGSGLCLAWEGPTFCLSFLIVRIRITVL